MLQFAVQGGWRIIPVHLNELSPEGQEQPSRAPSINASVNATLQTGLAAALGGNYAVALVVVVAPVAVIIAVVTALGSEAKGVPFSASAASGPQPP